ncbi:MAG TPA: alpha-amylase family protein [Cellvibrio sp.]|nr:alpha-amylase family protein [Cellvibrio sp.]
MKKLISALCAFFCMVSFSASAQQTVPRTVFVHLFEWQWTDIASECENYLGPSGYSAVQVSPPQKSISGSQWWTRYQPVSYSIEGRSGTRAQFADMVSRCKAVGVDIYVDAVINHMAAWSRNFPEVPYSSNDFHSCTSEINYSNTWQIQNCDLSGLNDLKTESDYVRGKIASYMNDLLSMGVAGFRIDAAKHMPAADISNIVGRLTGHPYIFQEVIGAAGEPVTPSQYTYVGDVTEFNYSNSMGHYFKGRGPIKDLKNIGSWSGWLASADAVVFVANHDNQRQNTDNIITHKDGGNLNVLAHIFMMAWPYGYPEIMSSYEWNNHDQGPPTSAASACNNGWLCEHRIRAINNMVAFRNNTNTAAATNQWDNGSNQVAWGRGALGYVAINRENSGTLNRTFQTSMPAGTYCDIIHADFNYATGACSGATITVASGGTATFSVNSRDAVAFHVGAKVGVPCPACGGNSTSANNSSSSSASGSTSSAASDSWYFRGTPNNWATTAMTLQDGLYCTQQQFGAASTNPRFKIDHFANWTESYPSADYVVAANVTYKICFNPGTKAITVSAVTASSSSSSISTSSSSLAVSSLSASSSSSSSSSSSAKSSLASSTGTTESSSSLGDSISNSSVADSESSSSVDDSQANSSIDNSGSNSSAESSHSSYSSSSAATVSSVASSTVATSSSSHASSAPTAPAEQASSKASAAGGSSGGGSMGFAWLLLLPLLLLRRKSH